MKPREPREVAASIFDECQKTDFVMPVKMYGQECARTQGIEELANVASYALKCRYKDGGLCPTCKGFIESRLAHLKEGG